MKCKLDLDKQLIFLDSSIVKTNFNGEEIVFTETETTGYAELKVITDIPSIFINNLDKCDLHFMKDKSCADCILIQKNKQEQWILRVIEFKKTLNIDKLIEVRKQIMNAIFKGLALKGCLGIEDFETIEGYCAFREDKVKESASKNPQLFKLPYYVQAYNEWTSLSFDIKSMGLKIDMKGIQMDSGGCAEIEF